VPAVSFIHEQGKKMLNKIRFAPEAASANAKQPNIAAMTADEFAQRLPALKQQLRDDYLNLASRIAAQRREIRQLQAQYAADPEAMKLIGPLAEKQDRLDAEHRGCGDKLRAFGITID
jgi:hypothetical protein